MGLATGQHGLPLLVLVAQSGVWQRKESRCKASTFLMGLDLNLVAAYGYPFAAAIDLLTQIRLYLNDDFVENMVGRLAASLLVVRTGTAFGLGLAVICTYSWWSGRSHSRAMVFSAVFSLFLLLVPKSFEIVYEDLSATAVIHTFSLLPGSTRTWVPLGRIASSLWGYGQSNLLGVCTLIHYAEKERTQEVAESIYFVFSSYTPELCQPC